jgi:putative DNA primase/helicase
MDATTEELQHLLAGQPRGLLYVRDELTGWFGNHDRYGGNGGDRAFFLEAWNGGAYTVDRVKHRGQPVRISRAALGIFGGMQPDRLGVALAGADDGLAARFAYIWPDPQPISKLSSEPDEAMRDRRQRLVDAARRLHGLKMCVDPAGEAAPGLLRLDRSAHALFDELRHEAMQRARSSSGLAGGWHGKTPGRALRLALVFELLAWSMSEASEPRLISGDAMARAGCYLDYLAAMFDRTTAGLAIRRDEADAAVIARHVLLARPATLNERELYQLPRWSWLRDSERRANALRVLADSGWIRQPTRTGSRRPRGDWQISPRLWRSPS